MTTQTTSQALYLAAHGFAKGARMDFAQALAILRPEGPAVPFEPEPDVPDDSPQAPEDEGDFTDAFREL